MNVVQPSDGPTHRVPWAPPAVDPLAQRRSALLARCRTELLGPADELGLAALLESWGVTDSTARSDYGFDDVFTLAWALRIELDKDRYVSELEPPPVPMITSTWALRGATYLPPAVFVAIALSDATAASAALLFAAITCVGWGSSEAVSRVAYTAINRGGHGAIRRTFARVLAVATPIALVCAAVATIASGSLTAGLLIGSQLLYLLAAVVTLPLDRERVLLMWIAPALVVAAALLNNHGPDYFVIVLVLSIIGEFAVLVVTAVHLHRLDPTEHGAPTRVDLRAAAPFLLAGIAMGAFVLASTSIVLTDIGSRRAMLALVVPLMASLSFSEISIRRFQSSVSRDLVMSIDLDEFASRARRGVVVYAASYAAVLAMLEIGGRFLMPEASTRIVVADYALFGMLGLCLFLTLVLMAMDHVVPVLVGYATASVLLVGGGAIGLPVLGIGQALLVTMVLLSSLLIAALMAVGQPAQHGFG